MLDVITVVKRSGRIETLDISKIQKYTANAVEGLEGVNQSELEVDAKIHFKDKITTEQIQKTLIQTAVDKIDIDAPNWTFVAARLFLYDLYHKVSGYTGYKKLKDYFELGESEGKILKGLKEKFDLELLDSKIDPNRDLQFNYLGIKTLYDRYLLKDKNNQPIELPQHMFMAIAMFLAQNEQNPNEWAIRFYDMISKFEVICATPTLANARTTRHQLSSCYVGSTPDNIEGIFDAYKEMALLSKYGGGIGWDLSRVRGLGSFIDGHKNAAGGVVPFLKIANDVAIAVDQLGTRKGAIATYLEVWHTDVGDFIDLRKNSGEERRRTHDLFPALWICDLFMKRVEANELWTLFDPYQCRDLTELYGEAFEKRYEEYEKDPNIIKEHINAKELWKKILTNYFESGLPFLCFKDNANRCNPNAHAGIIRSSNLCTEIAQNMAPIETVSTEISTEQGDPVVVTTTRPGEFVVCNLASLSLGNLPVTNKAYMSQVVATAVRALDNVIDLNFYPLPYAKLTNRKYRSIGLGVSGYHHMLAKAGIRWESEEHLTFADEVFETINRAAIAASSAIAAEKGSYSAFEGSDWQTGAYFTKRGYDSPEWRQLAATVAKQGMRNAYLLAVAPTSSTSILAGTTAGVDPVMKRFFLEEKKGSMLPRVAPELGPRTYWYYKNAHQIDQSWSVRAAGVRGRHIDQAQSMNLYITNDYTLRQVLNLYLLAWEQGVKTIYYIRSKSLEVEECESCSS